jgi:hypothetical protein
MSRSARVLRSSLVLLALAGVLLQGASLPHLHLGAGVGLYNAEHDLTMLTAFGSGALPPETPAIALALVWLPAPSPLVLFLSRAERRRFRPRAPPAR